MWELQKHNELRPECVIKMRWHNLLERKWSSWRLIQIVSVTPSQQCGFLDKTIWKSGVWVLVCVWRLADVNFWWMPQQLINKVCSCTARSQLTRNPAHSPTNEATSMSITSLLVIIKCTQIKWILKVGLHQAHIPRLTSSPLLRYSTPQSVSHMRIRIEIRISWEKMKQHTFHHTDLLNHKISRRYFIIVTLKKISINLFVE